MWKIYFIPPVGHRNCVKQVQDDSWQCASVTFIDDRFLIIDETAMYHIGASLKDLGKKWFAFSKFDKGVVGVLGKINRL